MAHLLQLIEYLCSQQVTTGNRHYVNIDLIIFDYKLIKRNFSKVNRILPIQITYI